MVMTYPIADAHAHIYLPKIAQRATEGIHTFYDIPYKEEEGRGTPEHLRETCRKAGVSRAVVSQVAMKVSIVPVINDFMLALYREDPAFYVPFASIHPQSPHPEELIKSFKEQGFYGLKLHPDYQQFKMDDPAVFPLYEACAQEGLPILFHCGDKRYHYSNPAQLAAVAKSFPSLRIQAAHFGGYSEWQAAFRELSGLENLIFDASSSLPYMPDISYARELIARFGKERILFGSDYPLGDPQREVELFLQLGLDEETNRAILYENFMRIYPLRG